MHIHDAHASDLALWVVFVAASSISLYIIGYNWLRHAIVYRRRKRGDMRSESGVIFIGPLVGMIAVMCTPPSLLPPPFHDRFKWLWIPWILDEQTWLILYMCLIFYPRQWWGARRGR